MRISVIIPIFKTEEYLTECVNSILEQATNEVEVILVDDGSPDTCPKMCDEFAAKDFRIKVIHKQNGGLSSARNAGMDIATGEYITFVDSDDKLFPSCLREVLIWSETADADLCFMKSVKLYPGGKQKKLGEDIEISHLKSKNREEVIAYLTSMSKYPGSAWGKLFKREFLVKNNIHFPYDRRFSEDLGFIRDCILCANKFDSLDVLFYQYRQSRPGSITNQIKPKNFYDLLMFISETSTQLIEDGFPKDVVSEKFMGVVAYEYSVLVYLYHHLPRIERKASLKSMKQFQWVMKFANNKREKIVAVSCSVLGIKFTSWLLSKYREVTEK